MTEDGVTERPAVPGRIQAALFFLAAIVSCGVGLPTLLAGPCPSCTGLLSLVLPWAGVVFYSFLGGLSWKRPASPLIPHALSLSVFVHACLVAEMLLQHRPCIGCLSIAGLAFAAAGVHGRSVSESRVTLLAALILGGVAGFLYPFDRAEDTLTRRFWPAHILSQAPAFVDQAELSGCAHGSVVRLFTYEDERTCQSCAGLERRVLGDLSGEFRAELCVHKHILPRPAAGQVLPVLVLLSRTNRLIVCEGVPELEELKNLIRGLIREGGAPPAPRGKSP